MNGPAQLHSQCRPPVFWMQNIPCVPLPQAEHAAIDHAGVAEHAAAEGSLAEAGAQLDALADVLRALEDRRGALQVG